MTVSSSVNFSTLENFFGFFEKNLVKVLIPLKGVLKGVPAYRSSPVLFLFVKDQFTTKVSGKTDCSKQEQRP